MLKEGRKYEALSVGNEQLTQLGLSNSEKVHAIQRGWTCHSCSMSHQPRQCPTMTSHAVGEDIGQGAVRKPDNNENKTSMRGKEVRLAHPKASIPNTRHIRKDTSHSANPESMWLTATTQMNTYQEQFHSITANHPQRRPTPH